MLLHVQACGKVVNALLSQNSLYFLGDRWAVAALAENIEFVGAVD